MEFYMFLLRVPEMRPIGYCRIPQAGTLGKYLLTQIDEPRFAEDAKQRVRSWNRVHHKTPVAKRNRGFVLMTDKKARLFMVKTGSHPQEFKPENIEKHYDGLWRTIEKRGRIWYNKIN